MILEKAISPKSSTLSLYQYSFLKHQVNIPDSMLVVSQPQNLQYQV